jgi:hypothetical protein
MNANVSPYVWEIIELVFPPHQQDEIAQSLKDLEDPIFGEYDRLCLGALALSGGKLDLLREAISYGCRDMLVAAGFGNDVTAHIRWADEIRARGKTWT